MIEDFLLAVGDTAGGWLYVLAALVVFFESAVLLGVVLPGETALLVAGFFCQNGTLSLAVMIPVGVVAAVAGDSVGFAVGQRFGPKLRHSRLGQRIGRRRWVAVDRALEGHPGRAVFLARLGAFLRSIMPFSAGASHLRFRVFLPWNALGALVWAPASVLVGYAFADALSTAGQYLTWAPLALIALIVVGAVAWRQVKRRRTRVTPGDGPTGSGGTDEALVPEPAASASSCR